MPIPVKSTHITDHRAFFEIVMVDDCIQSCDLQIITPGHFRKNRSSHQLQIYRRAIRIAGKADHHLILVQGNNRRHAGFDFHSPEQPFTAKDFQDIVKDVLF